jgi:hypothetical protein
MNAGVRFEVLWCDSDLIEIRINADNGRFGGVADCCGRSDAISRLAAVVRGFPSSTEDRREWVFGAVDSVSMESGVKLVLSCVNRSGHAMLGVFLRSDSQRGGVLETADFSIPIEPAALDHFAAALDRMPMVGGAVVSLPALR